MDELIAISGWIGLIFAISMFLPQIWKILKTKSVGDLAIQSFIINTTGVLFWSIYGALIAPQSGYQAWGSNFVIAILMIIPLWYLFKNHLIRNLFLILIIATEITSMSLILLKVPTNDWLELVFVLIAGSMTGFAFMPQAIKTIKTKQTKDIAMITILMVIGCNLFYEIYWIGFIVKNPSLLSAIFAAIFTALFGGFQFPILWIMISNKLKKNRINKLKESSSKKLNLH